MYRPSVFFCGGGSPNVRRHIALSALKIILAIGIRARRMAPQYEKSYIRRLMRAGLLYGNIKETRRE